MIRVLIADDQQLIRSGLRALLERAGDIEVVGEAADGLQAVALAASERPDVVLMDVRMPGIDGVSAPARVDVLLDYTGSGLRVVVSDDGPASGAACGAGQGLAGMRERVTLLGGTLAAGPVPPSGFRVEAVLPA